MSYGRSFSLGEQMNRAHFVVLVASSFVLLSCSAKPDAGKITPLILAHDKQVCQVRPVFSVNRGYPWQQLETSQQTPMVMAGNRLFGYARRTQEFVITHLNNDLDDHAVYDTYRLVSKKDGASAIVYTFAMGMDEFATNNANARVRAVEGCLAIPTTINIIDTTVDKATGKDAVVTYTRNEEPSTVGKLLMNGDPTGAINSIMNGSSSLKHEAILKKYDQGGWTLISTREIPPEGSHP